MTTTMPKPLERRVQRTNRIVTTLLRLGVPLGPMQLLTVTGRRSGVSRTTPIATFTFEGGRYVMQGFPGAAWVANVRAAGWGLVGRGRRLPRVTLVEVPVEERRPMLRHVGGMVSASMARMFVQNGLIESPDAESFAAAAPTIAVFRIGEAT
jgi:deazaflavin-dependent oxidoreductase (nitroreductase family)